MIKYKTKKVISLQDWDDLVVKTYGRPYSFQQQDGCKSRGSYDITVPEKWVNDYEEETVPEIVNGEEMGVSFKAWLARDPKLKITDKSTFGNDFTELWWDRNFYPDVSMIVNDLHAKGLLEEGNYTINIDW